MVVLREITADDVRDLKAEAATRGVALRLQVLRGNPARRLYEREGFVVVEPGERRTVMEYRPG